MAILWPAEPDFGRNTAEEVLWRALAEQLPEDATLLHSVNLLEESTEREIDLLVLWPGVGIAAIEVKGGTVWHNEQGWHQGSPTDSHRMNPLRQVQDARHVLQEKLRRRGIGAGRARTAHLVAFPHTRFAQDFETTDCPRSMIIDRDDVAGVAAHVRHAIVTHGQGERGLDEVDAQDLYDVLAGQLGAQVDILGEARGPSSTGWICSPRTRSASCASSPGTSASKWWVEPGAARRGWLWNRPDGVRGRASASPFCVTRAGSAATSSASRTPGRAASARPTWGSSTICRCAGVPSPAPTTTPTTGSGACRSRSPTSRRDNRRRTSSTPSSWTRPRTSGTSGGPRCSVV
ncbi:nuclease-related domain-containing protein [Occultella gossypii]|uniref:NERD domain-containing protein n=1 Tax=Occultella gossypii TaxID=2800820 RepID=A0ABS7SH33_9MICO|nr:NERD domain-containing protein [Occultella gossypii]